ncbi:MAG: succinate dehydrogenase cytochrome b subunit [Bdellovibrionaceae bacterium]|nr:succinate dehydrogenase cytochrome b subunit [Pseudobdellovibrionaceae bacterium]MDW8190264.1 succinate dehydrogenase cytochrome b subunit [Pseudobdellovibrionaceae bacterium]
MQVAAMMVYGLRSYLSSTVGKKFVMGVTGLIWAGFVFLHMLGNLLIFAGPEVYNSYAHQLTSSGLIYVAEFILLGALLTHVILAIQLTLSNRAARGSQPYACTARGSKSVLLSSRTMMFHGSMLLVFLITHLMGFKFGNYYETTVNGVVMRDLHRLVVEVFSQPLAVLWYLVALVLLGVHLSHGVGSIFQSLGLKTLSNEALIKSLSWTYAIVVTLGFLSQPIYVFLMMR